MTDQMRRRAWCAPLVVALCAVLWCAPAHAAGQSIVCEDANHQPQVVAPDNPCPVTTTPSATTASLTAETNGFQFTVTAGQDNALPVPPSNPGLTLPGRVCLDYPQQAYGSATTNTTYINVNWNGADANVSPHDQIAPGEHQICKYVTTTTPPHVAVNNGSTSPVIGVTN